MQWTVLSDELIETQASEGMRRHDLGAATWAPAGTTLEHLDHVIPG